MRGSPASAYPHGSIASAAAETAAFAEALSAYVPTTSTSEPVDAVSPSAREPSAPGTGSSPQPRTPAASDHEPPATAPTVAASSIALAGTSRASLRSPSPAASSSGSAVSVGSGSSEETGGVGEPDSVGSAESSGGDPWTVGLEFLPAAREGSSEAGDEPLAQPASTSRSTASPRKTRARTSQSGRPSTAGTSPRAVEPSRGAACSVAGRTAAMSRISLLPGTRVSAMVPEQCVRSRSATPTGADRCASPRTSSLTCPHGSSRRSDAPRATFPAW